MGNVESDDNDPSFQQPGDDISICFPAEWVGTHRSAHRLWSLAARAVEQGAAGCIVEIPNNAEVVEAVRAIIQEKL